MYISEMMLPARMSQNTNRNRYVSFGKWTKKIYRRNKQTNKQTKTSKDEKKKNIVQIKKQTQRLLAADLRTDQEDLRI